MSDPIYLRRSEAAKLLERIRELVCPSPTSERSPCPAAGAGTPSPWRCSRPPSDWAPIRDLLVEAGIPPLKPCDGEAHSNAHIDNCVTCAPRWGYVGPEVKVR